MKDSPEHFPNCIGAVESGDRNRIKEAVFFANHDFLTNIISKNSILTPEDGVYIITDVGHRLHQYDGNQSELGFRHWLTETAKPLIEFYAMKRKYARSVLAGVWSVLRGCSDLGIEHNTIRDLESRVWLKVHLHLDEWLASGTASLSTRLYSKARFETRAWRTSRLRDRERFTTLDELKKIEECLAQPRRTKATAHELAKATEESETIQ